MIYKIFDALNNLKNRGLIQKFNLKKGEFFSVSPKGELVENDVLDIKIQPRKTIEFIKLDIKIAPTKK